MILIDLPAMNLIDFANKGRLHGFNNKLYENSLCLFY
jgi:hypothetical protein